MAEEVPSNFMVDMISVGLTRLLSISERLSATMKTMIVG